MEEGVHVWLVKTNIPKMPVTHAIEKPKKKPENGF